MKNEPSFFDSWVVHEYMTPETPDIRDVIRLVLGIARLGENDLRGWWNGHALDRTGQYVLSSMFRRTWRSGALQLDVSAATRMHDELLGRSTALHMFSDGLPFRRWATGWLGEQKTKEGVADLLTTLETWSADQAMSTLRSWSGGIESPEGESLGNGLLLGRLSSADLEDHGVLLQTARRLSVSYLGQTGVLRPPYFDLAR
ncbi:MAG: BrxE family protein [Solirubrobacteraceae bacterium]